MKHSQALAIAQGYIREWLPYCERIELAGSLRRGQPEVHDIDLVAMPRYSWVVDLFNRPYMVTHSLEGPLDQMAMDRRFSFIKGGPRYKKIGLPEGINIELYLCLPPSQWGVLFTLRTGPGEFGKWLVTPRQKGGCMPSNAEQQDNCILVNGRLVPMPEEIDYLRFFGLDWIAPQDRKPHWGRPPVLPVADVPKTPAVMDL